jgi:phosphoglucomutase/phosphomannomutase
VSTEPYGEIAKQLRAGYPNGAAAWGNIEAWLRGSIPLVPKAELREFLDKVLVGAAPIDLLYECFWRNIPFGTGGVRGTVGFGPNRINPTVVALTIQAHCRYLDAFFAAGRGAGVERSVVIANDIREFHDLSDTWSKFLSHNPYHAVSGDPGLQVTSRNLAFLSAGVYAKNGYVVYMLKPGDRTAFLTTPELSFLIRWLRAAGGINLSASHNPPDDNGVKVYDENGGQYLPPDDQELTDLTKKIREADHMPYEEAVAAGLVRDIPGEALADYQSLYLDRAHERGLGSTRGSKILFTPLGGCGGRTVKVALESLGYDVLMPDREGPEGTGPDGTHGTFGAIPMRIANPEVPESTRLSKEAAQSFGAGLVLASDPDADRLGAEVYHQGGWRHLTGNQIGTILSYYLLLDPAGPRLRGAVYETAVTTLAVRAIADRAGCDHVVSDLLVGFKYIGHAVHEYLKEWEKEGRTPSDTELLVFATEESHGYLDTPKIRDKDAMAAALYLARLHEQLSSSNATLVDYLERIYAEVGGFGDTGRSLIIPGSRGFQAIQDVMKVLRGTLPDEFAGVHVQRIDDRRDAAFGPHASDTDWEARNFITFWFEYGRITFRPSGTEPKLKFYVQTEGAPAGADAQAYAQALAAQVYQFLLGIVSDVFREIRLDEAFASLPDVIAVETKQVLQDQVASELRGHVSGQDYHLDLTAGWLDRRVAGLVPGSASWKAVEGALRSAAATWGALESERVDSVFGYLREQAG